MAQFRRKAISDEIDRQLVHQPTTITRNRKPLPGLAPTFENVPLVWELRVGDYRVFYDVDETEHVVRIRAVRFKSPSERTEDIL